MKRNYKYQMAVVGDSLLDIYLVGYLDNIRFKVHERLEFYGGMANVSRNIISFLEAKDIGMEPHCYTNRYPLELTRFIENDIKLMEAYSSPTGEECLSINDMPYYNYPAEVSYQVVVVADYNKGTANKYSSFPELVKGQHDIVIVDSRYRSTHPDIIKSGKVKIWRCTGSEYDPEWAKQFDYVVWTDANLSVRVFNTQGHWTDSYTKFPVPTITPVDTCGAGDTFTAALATQLLPISNTVTYEDIAKAIPFCIEAAQQVCMKPYTAVWSSDE